jgi:hypothetical protein
MEALIRRTTDSEHHKAQKLPAQCKNVIMSHVWPISRDNFRSAESSPPTWACVVQPS